MAGFIAVGGFARKGATSKRKQSNETTHFENGFHSRETFILLNILYNIIIPLGTCEAFIYTAQIKYVYIIRVKCRSCLYT